MTTTAPRFGLTLEPRRYVCTLCGTTRDINTNHTATCYAHCEGCSWKSEGFGPGIRLGTGPIQREHAHVAA